MTNRYYKVGVGRDYMCYLVRTGTSNTPSIAAFYKRHIIDAEISARRVPLSVWLQGAPYKEDEDIRIIDCRDIGG